ncbi:MAG: hypothetical protein JW840_07915 [Candidatus Thermoplasmatota archaeon]|nr:hypothetical protein [Candidatus Thermoplasmatota archaeon]
MRTTCDYCHRRISKSPATLKKNQRNFCDRQCYANYQKEVWVYPKRDCKTKEPFIARFKKLIKNVILGDNPRIKT